jgi:hypothetical protein
LIVVVAVAAAVVFVMKGYLIIALLTLRDQREQKKRWTVKAEVLPSP